MSWRVLGASWRVFGASWARLGSVLARLGGVLARLGASWARVGLQKPVLRAHGPIGYRLPGAKPCAKSGCPSSWAHRVRVLEPSWARLGRVLARLSASWRALEASWRVLGASWRVLEASWARFGLRKPSQNRSKTRSKIDQKRSLIEANLTPLEDQK